MLLGDSVFLSYTCNLSFTQKHILKQPVADCLQKAGVEFIVSAPFRFMSANMFFAASNMRLGLAGKMYR